MTTRINTRILVLAVLIVAACVVAVTLRANSASAITSSTLSTTIMPNAATSSNPTVGPTAQTIFATSSCSARTISTGASAIRLTFTDGQGSSTGALGTLQLASTTVVYPAEQFGCGKVRAYSFVSQLLYAIDAVPN